MWEVKKIQDFCPRDMESCHLHGRHRTWSFHVVVLQRTAMKCTKIYNALAELLFCSFSRCRRGGGFLKLPLRSGQLVHWTFEI